MAVPTPDPQSHSLVPMSAGGLVLTPGTGGMPAVPYLPTQAAFAPPPPAGPNLFVETAKRFWPLLVLAAAAGAAGGYVAAKKYGTAVWMSEGQIQYRPAPLPDGIKYTPAALPTYEAMVRSKKNLEALAAEFDLPRIDGLKKLDKQVIVFKAGNADLITVKLDWPDREQGPMIVNRLMEMHIHEATAFRRDGVAQATLAAARQLRAANDGKLRVWVDYIATYRKRLATNPSGTAQALDATELDPESQNRRKNLQDKIKDEEGKLAAFQLSASHKVIEMINAKQAYERKFGARETYEKAQRDVQAAEAAVKGSEVALRGLKDELKDLPLRRASEQMLTLEANNRELDREIAQISQRAATPVSPTDDCDLQILTRATPADSPTSTNRKTILAMGVVGPTGLLFALLMGVTYLRQPGRASATVAHPVPTVSVERIVPRWAGGGGGAGGATRETILASRAEAWIRNTDAAGEVSPHTPPPGQPLDPLADRLRRMLDEGQTG